MTEAHAQSTDIVIVGGGITALVLALGLSRYTPYSIAVLEQHPVEQSWPLDSIDSRVSAISPGVQRLFQQLGVWHAIAAEGIAPYQHMHVWESHHTASIDFDHQSCGVPHLGYLIENRVMRKTLFQALESAPRVTWLCPKRGQSITPGETGHTLTCEDGTPLHAKLLVGADGARSWCRAQMGIPVKETPYGHHALVTTVRTTESHAFTPSQVFLPTGPLAFLPLKDPTLSSIVWSTHPEQADLLKTQSETEFLQTLTTAFESHFGEVTACLTPRLTFPLIHRQAKAMVQPRLALIGDAAHTLHPLAGQGLNMGILDAGSLVETLAQLAGADPGRLPHLRAYERWRRSENATMMTGVKGLKHLFETQSPPLGGLRRLGLKTCHRIPALKNRFIRQAMNISGHQPNFSPLTPQCDAECETSSSSCETSSSSKDR